MGCYYDTMPLTDQEHISLEVAEWFGMHLAEAIAEVVTGSGARSPRYLKPVRRSQLLRKVLFREGQRMTPSAGPQERSEAARDARLRGDRIRRKRLAV